MSSPARIRRWTESEASFIYQSKSKIKNFIGYPAELLENKYLIRPSQVFCRNPGAIKTFGGSIEIFLSVVKNSLSVFIRVKSWDPTFSFLSQKLRGEHLRTSAHERSPNFWPSQTESRLWEHSLTRGSKARTPSESFNLKSKSYNLEGCGILSSVFP